MYNYIIYYIMINGKYVSIQNKMYTNQNIYMYARIRCIHML